MQVITGLNFGQKCRLSNCCYITQAQFGPTVRVWTNEHINPPINNVTIIHEKGGPHETIQIETKKHYTPSYTNVSSILFECCKWRSAYIKNSLSNFWNMSFLTKWKALGFTTLKKLCYDHSNF
jgi:hypothetical protein